MKKGLNYEFKGFTHKIFSFSSTSAHNHNKIILDCCKIEVQSDSVEEFGWTRKWRMNQNKLEIHLYERNFVVLK